jgi:hypothetical protein
MMSEEKIQGKIKKRNGKKILIPLSTRLTFYKALVQLPQHISFF